MTNVNQLDVVKATELLGIECYQVNTAKKIGKIVDIIYSTQTGKIESISVKTTIKIENRKTIPIDFKNIVSVGDICLVELDY